MSTNPTSSSIDLSWDAVSGADSYTVLYRVLGASQWLTEDVSSNNLSLTGLFSGTVYLWKVEAICGMERSTYTIPAIQFATTGSPACGIPGSRSEQNITDVSALLNWSNVSGASSYVIQYKEIGATIWLQTTSTNSDKLITGLSAETSYVWKVRAACNVGGTLLSKFTKGKPFKTLPECETPSNLSASNIMDNSADLDWDDAFDATSYNLQYRVRGASAWTTVNVGNSNVNLSGLQSGLVYQWRVRTVCTGGVPSDFTEIQVFSTTGTPACATPSGLVSSNIMDNSADLTWNAEANAISYSIQYRVQGASAWITESTVTNSISITSLSPGLTYQWKVRTECSASIVSPFSDPETFNTTGAPECAPPGNLASSNITNSSADISWNTAPNAVSYVIEYKVIGATDWIQTTSGITSVSLTGLFSGQTYQYRARSVCSSSVVSAFSESDFFVTTGIPDCPIPINLQTSSITQNSADVSWDAVAGAVEYIVFFREIGQPIWQETTSSSTSISLVGLNSSASHEWKVRSVCSADNSLLSQFSAAVTFVTNDPPGSNFSNIYVYSMQGNLVKSTVSNESIPTTIKSLALEKGFYILKVSNNRNIKTTRIAIH